MKPRRPPSLPLICEFFPDHSSFSVLREIPVAFSSDYFKKLNGCGRSGPRYSDLISGALCRAGHCADQEDFKPTRAIREEDYLKAFTKSRKPIKVASSY